MTDHFKHIHLFIKESLGDYYSQHAFQREKEISGFIYTTAEFTQKVFIGVEAEYESFISYHPHFTIINNTLEKSKSEFFKGAQVSGGTSIVQSQGDQMARHFGVTEYVGWSGYQVRNKDEASSMINHHKDFMEKVGWSFLELTSTLEGINEFLNKSFLDASPAAMSHEEKVKTVRHFGAKGMINGVLAAWLVNEKEFEKLVSNYRLIFFPEHIQKSLDVLLEGIERKSKS